MEAPLSRVEAILQNILGADNVLVPPQSRVEEILLAILNNTEYIHPGDPSRVEEILLAIKDGGSYDKKALSRVEDILIHKLNDEEYTDYSEDDLSRVEKLLIQWIDLHPEVIKELTASSFPISILANGLPLLDYRIDGNSVQSGTPTPDSPIEPEFCGDLVSIELDEPLRAVGDYKDTLDLGTGTLTRYIQELVLTGKESWSKTYDRWRYYYILNGNPASVTNAAISNILLEGTGLANSMTFHISNGSVSDYKGVLDFGVVDIFQTLDDFKAYLAQQYAAGTPVTVWYVLAEPIVTTLSSIPDCLTGVIEGTVTQSGTPTPDNPIEPVFNGTLLPNGKYQVYKTYKIPISSAGQTKNIYLGQVQTTRRIKKYVITGEEDVVYYGARDIWFIRAEVSSLVSLCSHYKRVSNLDALTRTDFAYQTVDSGYKLRLHDSRFETAADCKAWLAQQYAAGTPVTVWYVLETPETGIVNEPLCRIGDYADSITFEQAGVEIPTLKKPNTTVIDVETEVELSSMYLKYSEPSDGPAPKTPVLGTKDREIYVTPNNEVYVLRR